MAETNPTIEIEREDKPQGYTQLGPVFPWHVRGRPEIRGVSRQPLLDACRVLKAMGEPPATWITLSRPGRMDWDLRTTVGYGATQTVAEETADGKPRFVKWREYAGKKIPST